MRGDQFYIGPFSGGLNLRDKLLEIEHTHTPAATNVIAGPDGVVKKRLPCVDQNPFSGAPAANITSLFFAEGAVGIPSAFIAPIGTKVYLIDVNSASAAPISGALVTPSGAKWSWIKGPVSGGQGPFYGIAGDSSYAPKYWNGGGGSLTDWTASSGTLDTGIQLVYFKNRVITFGQTGFPTRLKASAVGDPRNWDTTVTGSDTAWTNEIDPDEGGDITGIIPWKSYLLVFKNYKTYLVYDLDNGFYRQINGQLGAPAIDVPGTLCTTPYGITFVAGDGHIYLTDGVKFSRLTDTLLNTTAFGGISKTDISITGVPVSWKCCVYSQDKLYYSDQTNTWVYDFVTQAWWYFGGLAIQAFGVVPGLMSSGSSPLFGAIFQSSPAPTFWQLFQNAGIGLWRDGVSRAGIGGTAYLAAYETPPMAPMWFRRRLIQDYNARRRFHAIRGYFSGIVNVSYALDSLDAVPTFTALGTTAAGLDFESPVETTFTSMGVGNAIRFKFSSTDGNAWAVHPFSIYTQHRTD